jgi:hypothetical protein
MSTHYGEQEYIHILISAHYGEQEYIHVLISALQVVTTDV